ncbi:MAG: FecR domain-containing protein [Pseudomonadales bacterium]
MTNVHTLQTQEQRFDEASLWIAKLDSGLSDNDQQSLQQWMAANSENRKLFLHMAKLWDKMDDLSRLSDLFPDTQQVASTPWRSYVAMAASIVVVLFAGLWVAGPSFNGLLSESNYVAAQDYDKVYETAIGEHSALSLSDGTQIMLNTNSLVRVKYTDDYRLIVLERGEVHVDVAHDKTRPLSVLAGDKVIQAVGTAFSVEITSDDQVELLVTDGKVRVAVQKNQADKAERQVPEVLPASSVAVSKGEQLVLGSADEEIVKVEPEELNVKLSWKQGNLIFRGESLEDAIVEISRYTQVEFVILDEDLKKVRIAGLFKAGDVAGLLAALQQNFNITHQQLDGDKVLLTSE